MKVCLIYSGFTRTWKQCKGNHDAMLRPWPTAIIHRNEHHADLVPYKVEDWAHYYENRAGENQPENTINMWHNMIESFVLAPRGLDCYVRIRYDIILSGPIDFSAYDMRPDVVYIPEGNDYREGVNDQFAFGSWEAMAAYHSVYYDHSTHFAAGKMFHSESYLKHTLDMRGIHIKRLQVTNSIVR